MPDSKGRIQKGERLSPATEFQIGKHWRKPQAFRDAEWLRREYSEQGRSTQEIADEFGCTATAIIFWLRRHNIPRRSTSETRKLKHWGASGSDNPMFGIRGPIHPGWKGGATPERQAFYHSEEWKQVSQLVWRRDRGTCQKCNGKRKPGRKYHIHHRIHFGIREVRANIDNLVLLCTKCHRWIHSPANRHRIFLGAFQATLEGSAFNGGEVLG